MNLKISPAAYNTDNDNVLGFSVQAHLQGAPPLHHRVHHPGGHLQTGYDPQAEGVSITVKITKTRYRTLKEM